MSQSHNFKEMMSLMKYQHSKEFYVNFCAYVCACVRLCALYVCRCPQGPKTASRCWDVLNCHVGTGKEDWTIWKSSGCSYPPSHLSSPCCLNIKTNQWLVIQVTITGPLRCGLSTYTLSSLASAVLFSFLLLFSMKPSKGYVFVVRDNTIILFCLVINLLKCNEKKIYFNIQILFQALKRKGNHK